MRAGRKVEVFATSWIEIPRNCKGNNWIIVEVFATSWIEIQQWLHPQPQLTCRGLCDLVDWNSINVTSLDSFDIVEVFATSWIEIPCPIRKISSGHCRGLCDLVDWNPDSGKGSKARQSRGLCDLVDWNFPQPSCILKNLVEVFATSWIEIWLLSFYR